MGHVPDVLLRNALLQQSDAEFFQPFHWMFKPSLSPIGGKERMIWTNFTDRLGHILHGYRPLSHIEPELLDIDPHLGQLSLDLQGDSGLGPLRVS